jgi:hypothetical protein
VAKFMVILTEAPGSRPELSPEEVQRKVEAYQAWVGKFRAAGRYVSGEKLAEEGGRLLALKDGRLAAVDGPYVEAKEVVAGYFVFRAADYAEAVTLLRDSPFLNDYRVALRQTDPSGCGGD